jgi:hypothetical protein
MAMTADHAPALAGLAGPLIYLHLFRTLNQ